MHKIWNWFKDHPLLTGVLSGLLYGLACRMFIYENLENALLITTFGFVFLVPFVIGFLVIMPLPELESPWQRFGRAFFFPWVAISCMLLSVFLAGFEVMLCIFMASPIFFFMSSLGGIAAEYLPGNNAQRPRQMILASVLVLPLGVSAAENFIPLPPEFQEVRTQIDIQASPEAVWEQIKRVPTITEAEQTPNFFHWIGFPRPLAATLSHEGVGGVREATFEENVMFYETVTEWNPPESLAFQIEPELSLSTSPIMTDMILGGDYFDVLDGRYEIEPLDERTVRLHLSSKHRVSTHYNLYASFWTYWIMEDLQNYILRVLKRRAEAQS